MGEGREVHLGGRCSIWVETCGTTSGTIPRFLHIGYDEEHASDQYNHFHVTARQGELWWHDLNYTIGEVERNGAQAAMWSDAIWFGRETYLKHTLKGLKQLGDAHRKYYGG